MMLFLKESPKFLANIGQTDEALRVMKRIYTMNGGKDAFPVSTADSLSKKTKSKFCSCQILKSFRNVNFYLQIIIIYNDHDLPI